MARPAEYENLIKTKAFAAVGPTPGAIAGFCAMQRTIRPPPTG